MAILAITLAIVLVLVLFFGIKAVWLYEQIIHEHRTALRQANADLEDLRRLNRYLSATRRVL